MNTSKSEERLSELGTPSIRGAFECNAEPAVGWCYIWWEHFLGNTGIALGGDCWGIMPKFYCDYCDTYLTHDSPSVRKTHCSGRKHKENVKDYYQKWMEEQAQSLIDKTTAAFQQGKIPPTPFPGGPPPGGPPRPGMLPTPPMGGPPMMPMMGPPPHGMMPGGPGGMRPPMGGPMQMMPGPPHMMRHPRPMMMPVVRPGMMRPDR